MFEVAFETSEASGEAFESAEEQAAYEAAKASMTEAQFAEWCEFVYFGKVEG